MINAQVAIAYDQLKKMGTLTRHTFVKKDKHRGFIGTIVVKDALGEQIFYKTADLQTGQFVRGGNTMVQFPSALQALDQHFTAKMIVNDAMTEMMTLCSELNRYPDGTFANNLFHGQEVSFESLTCLMIENHGYINLQ